MDGKIYAIGISSRDPSPLEVYDPAANTWTELATMPTFYGFHTVAAYHNRIYDFSNNLAYDLATDSWNEIASMPEARDLVKANIVGDKAYLIGGSYGGSWWGYNVASSNWVYDLVNDSWSQMEQIPTPVASYASAVLNDKIYIFGGVTSAQYQQPEQLTNLVQIFDPQTNTWHSGTPLSSARYYLFLEQVNDKIYALGGLVDEETWLTDTLEYMPVDYASVSSSPSSTSPTPGLTGASSSPTQTVSPSPTVPEFHSWTYLAVLVLIISVVVLFRRKLTLAV